MLNPFVIMSALTGKPTKKGIHKYLSDLKALVIDQVMIYPRSGSEIEHLSEDWFCAVADFIDSAIILNMKLWLYDDFNWPSGDACGKVIKVEKFRLSSIKTKGENAWEITCMSKHNSLYQGADRRRMCSRGDSAPI